MQRCKLHLNTTEECRFSQRFSYVEHVKPLHDTTSKLEAYPRHAGISRARAVDEVAMLCYFV